MAHQRAIGAYVTDSMCLGRCEYVDGVCPECGSHEVVSVGEDAACDVECEELNACD